MLPNPLSFAVETVLKLPRPAAPIAPQEFKRMYTVIMRAKTRDELYSGIRLVKWNRQVTYFDPDIMRRQQEEGEQAHVERLKWAMRKKVSFLSADGWATAMMEQVQMSLDDKQAAELGRRLPIRHAGVESCNRTE